ncbi:ubiquitin carboxyl-terminal hydrolase 48 [Sarcoptes scabiei]|nr:ubiquitin carboxyl-terminal hydrolase 48 [Sarcoptes scabiei]
MQIFYSKTDMQLHTQIHMRESKPYKCSQCTKSFANSSYLSQHSRIHLGIKPYRCEMCQRKFTQLSHLQQHYRTHTGDKPYRCRFANCTKSFSQLSNLQSHSRSHQTDKPYKCNSCYKCFVDEAGLLEHIPKHKDSKHLKTHICQFCGKSYTQETYLSKHMQKHTDRNENKHQTHHHQQHHLQNHNQLQSSTSRNNQSSSGNVGVQTPMLGDNSGGYNLSKASNLNRSTSTSSSTSIDCSNLIISSSMPGLNAATSVASHSLNNLINNQPHLFLDQSQNFEQLQSSNQNLRNGDDALLYGVNQHQRISIDKNSIETIVSKSHIPVTLSPSSVPTISAAMPNVRSMPYAFPYDAFNFHQKLSSNPGLLLNDVNANFLSSNSRKLSNFNDPSVMPSSTSISSSSTSPTSSMIATKTGPTALPNQLIALNQIRSYASLPVAVGQTIINNDHLQQHQTNLNHRHQQQSISLKED